MGDSMLSFAEYSPWVAERRLPLVSGILDDGKVEDGELGGFEEDTK